jgi:thiamine-monophosphate kinase
MAGEGVAARTKSKRAEREMIAAIRRQAAQQWRGKNRTLVLGIGDDCAVLRPRRGEDLVVTTDLSLEQVHFRRDWHPPESVGHRCLARGLSDLAAMGARPEAAFLSLAIPRSLSGTWVESFWECLLLLAERYEVPLAGGDLAESPPALHKLRSGLITADIVLLGSLPCGRALLRSGARAGDVICVSGALGGAAAELRALEKRPSAFRKKDNLRHPHLYPEPRIALGRLLLRTRLATAAIDLSDGLSTDLTHLCEESQVTAMVNAEAIPITPRSTLEDALHGGEDYELLFTVPSKTAIPAKLGGVPIRAIGRISKYRPRSKPVLLVNNGKQVPLRPRGWEHFR